MVVEIIVNCLITNKVYLTPLNKAESSGLINDGVLMVKVDNGYSNHRSAKLLEVKRWYDILYVVNNNTVAQGGQNYDVYIKGGEFDKQTLVFKNAQFRKKRELPLIYFLANSNTGSYKKPYGNRGLKYDDLYMVKGVNLITPR